MGQKSDNPVMKASTVIAAVLSPLLVVAAPLFGVTPGDVIRGGKNMISHLFTSANASVPAPASLPSPPAPAASAPLAIAPSEEKAHCSLLPKISLDFGGKSELRSYKTTGGLLGAEVSELRDAKGCIADRKLTVFSAHNDDVAYQPASIAKNMTVYIALAHVRSGDLRLDHMVKIPDWVKTLPDSRSSGIALDIGKPYTVETLIRLAMAQSNNWATEALGIHIARLNESEPVLQQDAAYLRTKFVDLMNVTAEYIGLTKSRFTTPSGLPSSEHIGERAERTTARDMMLLLAHLRYDFEQQNYLQVVKHEPLTVNGIQVNPTSLKLPRAAQDFEIVKTGTVTGCNSLVSTKQVDGKQFFSVVLCAEDRAYAHRLNDGLYPNSYYKTAMIQPK